MQLIKMRTNSPKTVTKEKATLPVILDGLVRFISPVSVRVSSIHVPLFFAEKKLQYLSPERRSFGRDEISMYATMFIPCCLSMDGNARLACTLSMPRISAKCQAPNDITIKEREGVPSNGIWQKRERRKYRLTSLLFRSWVSCCWLKVPSIVGDCPLIRV